MEGSVEVTMNESDNGAGRSSMFMSWFILKSLVGTVEVTLDLIIQRRFDCASAVFSRILTQPIFKIKYTNVCFFFVFFLNI